MQAALAAARAAGGVVHGGERVTVPGHEAGYYVRPALVELAAPIDASARETFAPILYVFRYRTIEDAIAGNNGVAQGLSSSLITQNLSEAELFLSAEGSDCGIANINIGPSGAEIGGAFGGEKETGGGRESARTPGRRTCGARRRPSTTPRRCRSRRASSSTSSEHRVRRAAAARRAPASGRRPSRIR